MENKKLEQLKKLYENKEYEAVSRLGKVYINESEKHYYDFLKLYIDSLVKTDKKEEALELVLEELRLPYVPEPYFSHFSSLYVELDRSLNSEEKAFNPFNLYSNDELKELLLTNEESDILIVAINEISNRNIRLFLDEIQMFLNNNSKKNFLKVVLIESLAAQGVEGEFSFINNGINYILNPMKMPLILEDESIEEIINIIERFDNKNKSIIEMVETLLIAYIVSIFPLNIEKKDYLALAATLFIVANEDLMTLTNHEDILKQFKVENKEFEVWYKVIKNNSSFF